MSEIKSHGSEGGDWILENDGIIDKNNPENFDDVASIMIRTRQYAKAIQILRSGLKLHWNNAALHRRIAHAYSRLHNTDLSLSHYDHAINICPPDYEAFYGKGCLLRSLNRYDEAILCFQIITTINPSFGPAYEQIGWAFCFQQQWDTAITWFQEAISRTEVPHRAYFGIGTCHKALGLFDEALEYLEKAIHLCPREKLYRENLAEVLAVLSGKPS